MLTIMKMMDNDGRFAIHLQRLAILCIGVLGFMVSSPAYAQDDTPLIYGDVIEGEISNEVFRDLYSFQGRSGEIVTIQMLTTAGDLDPFISLVDGQGRGIAFSDDDAPNGVALLDSFRLPSDSTYFLIATRFGHGQGSTVGSYTLSLELVGAVTRASNALLYGDTILGTLDSEMPQRVYTFQAQRGDVVNIRMERTSGNLDAYLDLANAGGQVIYSNDDDPTAQGTLNAGILNFTITQDGFYLVVATRYGREAGDTSGSYLLTIDEIPEVVRGLSPPNAILIDYEDIITSDISGEIPQRFYTFEGLRGDVVTIELQRANGNLNPFLMLLDDNQTQLASDGDTFPYDQARINAYTLPENGTYYIMATRVGFSTDGFTAGNFSLTLSGRAGITGGQYLEIFYDTEISGRINDILPFESFVFQAESGDIVTIRMNALNGDLDPLLTLYQDGKQLVFDDDSGDGSNAAIIGYQITESGIYRVEASRFERENGSTEGEYELRLESR